MTLFIITLYLTNITLGMLAVFLKLRLEGLVDLNHIYKSKHRQEQQAS